jgi:glycerophosphoryl diester phosphodiesterase
MEKLFKILCIVFIFATLSCQKNNNSDNQSQEKFVSPKSNITNTNKSLMIFAHRGGGRAYAPDNSIPNIRNAIKLGITAVEVDLIQTKDNKIILWHKETLPKWYLDPSADKTETVRIADLTYEEIMKIRYTQWIEGKKWEDIKIVSGEELVLETKNKINLVLDKKSTMPYDLFIDFIKRHDIAKQSMVPFGIPDANVAENVRKMIAELPEVTILMGTNRNFEDNLIQNISRWGVDCVYSPDEESEIDVVKKYKMLACLSYHAVKRLSNTDGNLESIIKYGIDCAMTDDPDKLKNKAINIFGNNAVPKMFTSFYELIKKPRNIYLSSH